MTRNEGTASINPFGVKIFGKINHVELRAVPIFFELQLYYSNENLLAERLRVFGPEGIDTPLARLLENNTDNNELY